MIKISTHMDDTKHLNPSESLDLINSMINTSKNRLADDGFFIIFWGWLILFCSLINYVSILMGSDYGSLVWPILPPLGGIFSIIYGRMQKKKETVKTYIDSYLTYSWGAFILAMFITLLFMPANGLKTTYFFLMLLYGMATLISGGLLNFRPLIIGSLFSFACAVVSVFVAEREQLLCIAASLLLSYIIPGHLLQAKYKSQVNV